MTATRSELRTAMMARVEVSWEEHSGTAHAPVSGTLEDKSTSGACLRLRENVAVGSTVLIKRPWEEISGVARYCRKEGQSYVVGIQRVAKHAQSPPPTDGKQFKTETRSPAPAIAAKTPAVQRGTKSDSLRFARPVAPPLTAPSAEKILRSPVTLPPKVATPTTSTRAERSPSETLSSTSELASKNASPQASAVNQRRDMPTKWLGMTFNRHKQEPANGASASGPSEENAAVATSPAGGNGRAPAAWQGDLQSPEDVYRAAGITTPRSGYGVAKIIEMMNSDHIQGLANDAKHAAIMMALDVAGIPVENVLRDASLRQEALNEYEISQRKSFEEHWSRIAELNAQIQTELDRIKLQSLERIKRNLDEISSEKIQFAEWQTRKREEAERIAEAVGLCSISSRPSAPSDVALSAAATASKSS